MSNDGDVLSELLIARLLEEDMRVLTYAQEAEKVQLGQALSDSALAAGRFPRRTHKSPQESTPTSDSDLALRLLAEEMRMSSDAAYAQSLQHSDDASITANRQQAQRIAAAEKKYIMDAEFARRLQDADESIDIDDARYKDAENVLGPDTIEQLLASDPNDKGKKAGAGKGKYLASESQSNVKMEQDEDSELYLSSVCGICMESFQATYSPLAASASANSSSRLQFGLTLPCPGSHTYCLACLGAYIRNKLDPEGDGSGNPSTVVFPIRCPECPIEEWTSGITDEIAARILPEKSMVAWHHQKLLDSMPRYYCPNPRCSVLVQVHDDPDEPQATCPSCSIAMCVPCRVVWHESMTCEEYQALPLDERSPEDQQALQLMKAKHWRRCPNCSFIIELSVGCNHITCRCKTEFCFRCGSLWDVRRKRCTRNPACELWDEDMLLEERERQRERRQPPAIAVIEPRHQAAPPPPYVEHDAGVHQGFPRDTFDWMNDPNVLCPRHWFTAQMIQNLECGYCDTRLNSLADLQYHLRSIRRHNVYACCGRFFRREEDFERHSAAVPRRFGFHVHTVQREGRV